MALADPAFDAPRVGGERAQSAGDQEGGQHATDGQTLTRSDHRPTVTRQEGVSASTRRRSGGALRSTPWYRSGVASLAIVLGLMGGTYWALRKWVPAAKASDSRVIQIAARTAISPRQGLVLVRIGRQFVLVGCSQDRMDVLARVRDPSDVADLTMQLGHTDRQPGGGFAQLLDRRGTAYDAECDESTELESAADRQRIAQALFDDGPGDNDGEAPVMAALRDRLRGFRSQA